MSDAWNEDERLAAFLDGRMDERERAEMLARLATDDEAYEVFAHAAAILNQEEADAAAAAVPGDMVGALAPAEGNPPAEPVPRGKRSLGERSDTGSRGMARRRTGWRMPVPARVALAAVLVGVAVVAGLALRSRNSDPGDPVRLAARLEDPARALPAGLNENPLWPVRGGGPTRAGSPEERAAEAARVGAYLADLAVAVQAKDSAQTWLLAQRIADRFHPPPSGAAALRKIADAAGSPPGQLRPLVARATDRIAGRLASPDALRVGAWLEAARLAAATRDAAFFDGAETGKMLDAAARITTANPAGHAAVEKVRPLLPPGAGAPRWDALGAALEDLLRELGSA